MEQNQPKTEPKTAVLGVRDLIVRNYLATIGHKGGKAGSRADKQRAGKLGAKVRWATWRKLHQGKKHGP